MDANFKVPMTFSAPYLETLLSETLTAAFDSEGRTGYISGQWARLSKKYAEWKQRQVGNKPILVFSGKLRDALANNSSANALRYSDATRLEYGTRGVGYAQFHQTGTRTPMPARPPFDFGGNKFQAALVQAGQRGIVDAVRAARLEAK
jgi:hypothetical protein